MLNNSILLKQRYFLQTLNEILTYLITKSY